MEQRIEKYQLRAVTCKHQVLDSVGQFLDQDERQKKKSEAQRKGAALPNVL